MIRRPSGRLSFRKKRNQMNVELRNVDEIAFFRVNGYDLIDIGLRRDSGRLTVYFVLKNEEMTEEKFNDLRHRFLNRKAVIEPRLFCEMLKDTNDLIFENLRKAGRR